MVQGQLTIIVSACLIRYTDPQAVVQAVLHAQIGQQHLQTKPIRSQIKKQLAWQEKLLFKVTDQRVVHFWLSDELRKGQQHIIGQCIINLNMITSQKFPLFLYSKQKQTAIIDVEMKLDSQGGKYVNPQKRTKKNMVRFLIKNAILTKDMQLIGSMRPTVRIRIGATTHETLDKKGKNPVWDQQIIFQSVNRNDDVFFTILDKQLIGKDDVIGTINISLQKLRTQRSYNLDIMSEGQLVGNLKFDIKHYLE